MLPKFAIFTLTDRYERTGAKPEARLYEAERLTDMQSVLAALADLETEHEIEREQIAQRPGSDAMKQQRLTDLDDRHRARRETCQGQWERLNSGYQPALRSG